MGVCLLSRLRSAADEVIWCWPHPAVNYNLRLCSKEATFLNSGKFISESSHWVLGKRREAEPEPALYGRPVSVGSSPHNLYCILFHSVSPFLAEESQAMQLPVPPWWTHPCVPTVWTLRTSVGLGQEAGIHHRPSFPWSMSPAFLLGATKEVFNF